MKVFVLIITIGPSLCRQCDEDLVGFRKLGMHRKYLRHNGTQDWGSRSLPLSIMQFFPSRFVRRQRQIREGFLLVDRLRGKLDGGA